MFAKTRAVAAEKSKKQRIDLSPLRFLAFSRSA